MPDISGFAFVKEENANMLRGHWWMGEESEFAPNRPHEKIGEIIILRRLPDKRIPHWATKLFDDIRKHGLRDMLP